MCLLEQMIQSIIVIQKSIILKFDKIISALRKRELLNNKILFYF